MVMESSAEIQTSFCQLPPMGSNAVMKMRRKTAKAAALGPAERKAATGVGAPWYTSGAQIWKGEAETLKPRPTKISEAATPVKIRLGAFWVETAERTVVRFREPVVP